MCSSLRAAYVMNMDGDLNYDVYSSFLCRLCCVHIEQKNYRYLVKGKKEFHVVVELENLPSSLQENNSRYICRPRLEKLKKRCLQL